MVNKKKEILVLIGFFFAILLISSVHPRTGDQTSTIQEQEESSEPLIIEHLRTSGNWDITEIISINATAHGVGAQNWTWVSEQDWFGGGDGTEEDPYLFENMTITVDDADDAGLTIINSVDYFKLSNVTIVNDGGDGVKLQNVTNGYVVSSNFSLNGNSGMYLNNVNNTDIVSTYCLNNTVDGIYAVEVNDNYFAVDCSNNGRYGLILASSDNNTVVLSQFFDNTDVGLVILELEDHSDAVDNEIYGNEFDGNTINAVDNSTLPNNWNKTIGNTWDDYSGADADDDGVGDTEYDIPGSAEAKDYLPVFDDGAETPALSTSSSSSSDDDDDTPTISTEMIIIMAVILIGGIIGTYIVISLVFPHKKLIK